MSEAPAATTPEPAEARREAGADDTPASPQAALELLLHPDDVARLGRLPEIVALVIGRPRPTTLEIVWHDTPDAGLAEIGLALSETRLGSQRSCRLEQLRPWPGLQPAMMAEAATLAALADTLPAPLAPMAALHGQQRSLRLAGDAPIAAIEVWSGTLRSVAAEHPAARLRLRGAPDAVFDLAATLMAPLRLGVAPMPLAIEALALARPRSRPRAPAAPVLEPGLAVGDAFAGLVAQLTATILHHAPAAAAGEMPEPVHQMRVALRRLRSAISLFARATWCPELDIATAQMKPLAAALGPARDWDVFTAGTGRTVGAAFEDERAVARLLVAAERRRLACYQTLRETLEGADFRILALTLMRIAVTRPWERQLGAGPDGAGPDGVGPERAGPAGTGPEGTGPEGTGPEGASPLGAGRERGLQRDEMLSGDLRHYATHALARRLRRAQAAGQDTAVLSLADLHALRIQCKRLRYAAEFFAPLFPGRETRRFIRRLSALQERLGHLNDGAVAGTLMSDLGGAGGERAFATGVVRGFVAAQTQGVRAKAERSWRKFQHLEAFWD